MEYTFRNGETLRVDYNNGELRINNGRFISKDTADALKRYTRGSEYKAIREAQQQGVYNPMAEQLESLIANSPAFKGDIYRGIKTTDKFYIGQTIDMRGVSSWSESLEVAQQYAGKGGVVFHTKDIGVAISSASAKEHEQEVLVSSMQRWMVTDITKDKYTYIELQ